MLGPPGGGLACVAHFPPPPIFKPTPKVAVPTEEVSVGVLGQLDQEGQVELETHRELKQQLVDTVQPLNN